MAEFARPYIEELSRRTGETVDLALLDGPKAVFVDQVQGTHRLRAVSAVGVSFPLHCTANGKALLAALAPDALARLKPQIRLGSGPSRGSWKQLEAELAEVRQTGIAYDREEHSPGISAVGVAVIGPQGELVAVSIPAPSMRFAAHEAELVAALRHCCSTLQNLCSDRKNSTARPSA
jgi:DNA-binding IclR family transcriptional regulator